MHEKNRANPLILPILVQMVGEKEGFKRQLALHYYEIASYKSLQGGVTELNEAGWVPSYQ
ncbi:hypothetical protein NC796_21265 [Aliifodinibius sp. S!AR15-10]|uniref:hypothetical protein n=1 Tax=Aliifodinibius sp. S!AR15-10 TaxID=2950437 RepID=UPI0028651C02|nr:hypothetical protein [Aliifodinibius sp. S!AR15-10]MDR8393698.1 hypothetical protein [Aliifodinibius sp. S!AR15-10]